MEKQNNKKEIRAQNKEFVKKLNDLFKKKYSYSLRYEDSLIADDGKAYVNVDLTKLESPFSVFSYSKHMDPEIYHYIDQTTNYLRVEVPIVINFDDGGKYSEELKEKIKKCVVRHYSLEYEDKRREHKNSLVFAIILMIIGVILLSFHFVAKLAFDAREVISEIMLILSWMFIWQGADMLLISGHIKRRDIYNAGQLALAEVTFGKPKNIN